MPPIFILMSLMSAFGVAVVWYLSTKGGKKPSLGPSTTSLPGIHSNGTSGNASSTLKNSLLRESVNSVLNNGLSNALFPEAVPNVEPVNVKTTRTTQAIPVTYSDKDASELAGKTTTKAKNNVKKNVFTTRRSKIRYDSVADITTLADDGYDLVSTKKPSRTSKIAKKVKPSSYSKYRK